MPASHEGTHDLSRRQLRDSASVHQTGSPRLNQSDTNRLALRYGESDPLPLKASNLELLARQHHSIDQSHNRHGGSAALLHASRARHGARETLAYASLDAHGNHSTEAFRPRRSSDRRLCLVEVLEEPDQWEPRGSQHASSNKKHSNGDRMGKEGDLQQTQQRAVQIGQNECHKFYKIR